MKISKRAAQGLQGTSALQTVQGLGTQIKGLLDKLTPMMQNLQASIPEINSALEQVKQLETQVGQLEQMKAQMAQQTEQAKQPAPTPAAADDGQEQDAKDNWLRWAAGNAWAKIVKVLGPDRAYEVATENAVAGVRGEAPLPGVVKVSKDRLPNDKLKGGEADNVPEEKLNKKQLDMGQKVEMEHTDDEEIAREIARDHLSEELKDGKEKEDQEYYTQLKKMHDDKCNDLPAFWRSNLDYGSR